MKKLFSFALFLGLLGTIPISFAEMYQDSSGRWVNSEGGNIYGDSRYNIDAHPRYNINADPRYNINADPRYNICADPNYSLSGC